MLLTSSLFYMWREHIKEKVKSGTKFKMVCVDLYVNHKYEIRIREVFIPYYSKFSGI